MRLLFWDTKAAGLAGRPALQRQHRPAPTCPDHRSTLPVATPRECQLGGAALALTWCLPHPTYLFLGYGHEATWTLSDMPAGPSPLQAPHDRQLLARSLLCLTQILAPSLPCRHRSASWWCRPASATSRALPSSSRPTSRPWTLIMTRCVGRGCVVVMVAVMVVVCPHTCMPICVGGGYLGGDMVLRVHRLAGFRVAWGARAKGNLWVGVPQVLTHTGSWPGWPRLHVGKQHASAACTLPPQQPFFLSGRPDSSRALRPRSPTPRPAPLPVLPCRSWRAPRLRPTTPTPP